MTAPPETVFSTHTTAQDIAHKSERQHQQASLARWRKSAGHHRQPHPTAFTRFLRWHLNFGMLTWLNH